MYRFGHFNNTHLAYFGPGLGMTYEIDLEGREKECADGDKKSRGD